MKVLCAKLVSDTASFVYPNMLVGRQVTYLVPPLSTIYGILLSAAYESFDDSEIKVGFLFYSEGETVDVVNVSNNMKKGVEQIKTNVYVKELLSNVRLELYIMSKNEELLDKFRHWLKYPKERLFMGSSEHFVEPVKSEYVKCIQKPKKYLAGPGLYPVTWTKYAYGMKTIERMSYYIVPPERKRVLKSDFLALLDTQELSPEFEKDKDILGDYIIVPTFDSTARYYPTRYRVVYMWSIGKNAVNNPVFYDTTKV
ncbi:MAG: CRISPR-associated protein Cas5 [Nitrososphaeria archaeon]